MKKFLLAAAVIGIFIVYSYHQRHDNSEAQPVIMPAKSAGSHPADAPGQSATVRPLQAAYKDGTYTGSEADAFYGLVQVQAKVQNGKITTVTFLEYPNDNRTSRMINSQATPALQQEAIQSQSAHVDVITGATQTSMAFVESLASALAHAS